jgi:hypothetical protein
VKILLDIEIKWLTSSDLVGQDGIVWELRGLPDQDTVRINFDLNIGEVGTDTSDIFTSVIFTGNAKTEYLRTEDLPYEGRVFYFDRFEGKRIWDHLNAVVASCARPTWEETATELNKHFLWEFEGM